MKKRTKKVTRHNHQFLVQNGLGEGRRSSNIGTELAAVVILECKCGRRLGRRKLGMNGWRVAISRRGGAGILMAWQCLMGPIAIALFMDCQHAGPDL